MARIAIVVAPRKIEFTLDGRMKLIWDMILFVYSPTIELQIH